MQVVWTTAPTNHKSGENEVDSTDDHVYSAVEENDSSQPTDQQLGSTIYEGVYSNCDTLPASIGNSGAQDRNLGGEAVESEIDGDIGDIITEHTYEMPQISDGVAVDDGCYSCLGQDGLTYAQLQPHIPKPAQSPLPPSDDEYSSLQHK